MGNFQWERLSLALGAVGAAEDILATAIEYAKNREAFGQPIAKFQLTKHKLADLATDLECARQLTYHALRLHAAGEWALGQTAMAKRWPPRCAAAWPTRRCSCMAAPAT